MGENRCADPLENRRGLQEPLRGEPPMTHDAVGAAMPPRDDGPTGEDGQAFLRNRLHPYQTPSLVLSFAQLTTSVLPFIGCWALMVVSLDAGYAVTLLLAIPAAGFLVRIFII